MEPQGNLQERRTDEAEMPTGPEKTSVLPRGTQVIHMFVFKDSVIIQQSFKYWSTLHIHTEIHLLHVTTASVWKTVKAALSPSAEP